ncbi:hypothetical protein PanWU01x14_221480 [Parasponia andersonii]|uniref:Uncharacterized protein n=1 Tax=Parasponia andersonii TaxID=3476 RepID=A0A2P5BP93_PARAD|nr:hypothetical protein PanWU01x14_221480 [Parasponia andersonii]
MLPLQDYRPLALKTLEEVRATVNSIQNLLEQLAGDQPRNEHRKHIQCPDQPDNLKRAAEQCDHVRGHVQFDKQQGFKETRSLNSRVREIEGQRVRDQRDAPKAS